MITCALRPSDSAMVTLIDENYIQRHRDLTKTSIKISVSCLVTLSYRCEQMGSWYLSTLNTPVPYKYGTNQWMEPQFHAVEPHSSHTSRALPTLVASRALEPRFWDILAIRISTQAAPYPRIPTQLEPRFRAVRRIPKLRISAHFRAITPWR